MSSILKALRKIEEQKRSVDHVAPDLTVDQGAVPVKTSPVLPLLTGVALGALVVAVTFLWLARDPADPLVSPVQPPPAEQNHQAVTQPTTGQPGSTLPPPATDSAAAPRSALPPDRVGFSEKIPVVTLKPEPLAVAPRPRPVQAVAQPVTQPATPLGKAVKAAAASPVAEAQTPPPAAAVVPQSPETAEWPVLLVTEIFYQDDHLNSMAVVNDLPVMVGTQVDSAVVKEILPDSVVFTRGDKTLTVAVIRP